MKTLLLGFLVLTLSINVHADETREYKKLDSKSALVTIKTEETDSTQAAIYVDAQENQKFVEDLRRDPNSKLAQLVKKIELENCEQTSTPDDPWIDGCGEVEFTDSVSTSFGRGGWMSAGASYTFFVGFRSDGTGRFFEATHMVTIGEGAEAQTIEDTGEYNGVILKTLTLDSVKEVSVF